MTLVLQHALITSMVMISRVVEKHNTTGFDPANNVEGDQDKRAAGNRAHAVWAENCLISQKKGATRDFIKTNTSW